MKRRITKMLIITLFGVTLLTLVTATSYLALTNKYGVPKDILSKVNELMFELKSRGSERQIRTETYKETYLDIIMTKTDENEKTEYFVLEAVNAASGKIMLITIPGSTKITMSNLLYVELQGETPAIPQIIQLENVVKHAGTVKGPLYVKKILEDFLGMEIDYYTVLPHEAFFELLTYKDDTITVSDDIVTLLELPVTKRRTMEIFKKIYDFEGFESNMTYEVKCKYLEFYEGLELSDIIIYVADGKNMNEAFIMDGVKVNQVIYKHLQ